MKRLLVTGANGFIGSRVVRAALAAGWRVAGLARRGRAGPRLRDVAGRVTWLRGDLASPRTLRAAVSRWPPDACIHLAWIAEPDRYRHAPENLDCLTGSLALLRALLRAGCRRVVMAGTCAEYAPGPARLREDAPLGPVTLYAACKRALGELARPIARVGGARLAWARLFHLYGPAEDPRRVVPSAILALAAGRPFRASRGSQVRDYLHVDDAASALLRLAARGADGTFNVCSGSPVTIRAMLKTIGRLMKRPGLLHFGAARRPAWDPARLVGDNRRLRALGWTPSRTLEEGLADAVPEGSGPGPGAGKTPRRSRRTPPSPRRRP
jgi:nucleoside-diphosphate-sugar epimerase